MTRAQKARAVEVARRAEDAAEPGPCPACGGAGVVLYPHDSAEDEECPACEGTGVGA